MPATVLVAAGVTWEEHDYLEAITTDLPTTIRSCPTLEALPTALQGASYPVIVLGSQVVDLTAWLQVLHDIECAIVKLGAGPARQIAAWREFGLTTTLSFSDTFTQAQAKLRRLVQQSQRKLSSIAPQASMDNQ